MTDIVDRLREAILRFFSLSNMAAPVENDLLREAADEIERLRKERDLAIAHDTQPYPTADAYEKVCAARTKWQERAEHAEAVLEETRRQLAMVNADAAKAEAALGNEGWSWQEEALTWWRYVDPYYLYDEDKELYEKYRALAEKEKKEK